MHTNTCYVYHVLWFSRVQGWKQGLMRIHCKYHFFFHFGKAIFFYDFAYCIHESGPLPEIICFPIFLQRNYDVYSLIKLQNKLDLVCWISYVIYIITDNLWIFLETNEINIILSRFEVLLRYWVVVTLYYGHMASACSNLFLKTRKCRSKSNHLSFYSVEPP